MTDLNRYIWQFTAEEWLGPRVLSNTSTDVSYAQDERAVAIRRATGVRVQVGEVWADHSHGGSIVFDAPVGGKVIGVSTTEGLSTIDPAYAGRGIITQVGVDGYLRKIRKINPAEYLRSRAATLTVDGERYTARYYAETIKQAAALGYPVEKRVLDSAAEAIQRYEGLRKGDDSALQLLPEKERQRKEKRNVSMKYRWVKVSKYLMDWLAAAKQPLLLKRFEKLVVVDER